MAWKRKHLGLTVDQRKRGVVFSSTLVRPGETEADTIHEVLGTDPEKDRTIKLLLDVNFFKDLARDAGWTVTEIVRS